MSKMIEISTTAGEITAVWLTKALRTAEVIGEETAVSYTSGLIRSFFTPI